MKFTEVETFVVANPAPGYGGKYFVFVKLSTDTGAAGWGEVHSPPFDPATISAVVADLFDRSVRDRVRSYTYLYPGADDIGDEVYSNPSLAAQRALSYVEAGHNAIKFDPAGPYRAVGPRQPTINELDRSEAFVNEIRAAVGPRADLLFGTHGQFTPSGAIRLGQRLEAAAPLWFEEPCPPDLPDAMAEVARHCTVPIAAGERLTSIHEFQRLLVAGVGILQPNLARAGGITAGKKIAAIAEVYGAQVAPHLYSGPIGGAANIAVAATIPNFLILEGIQDWGGFHAEILTNPVRWEAGYVHPFTEPGLGTEVDEDVARANEWTGGGLHLEMTEDTNDWPG